MPLWLEYSKTVVKDLLLPPASPLLLAVSGLLLWRRRPKAGLGLLIAGIGSLWLLATPVVSDALARLAERYPALDLSRPVTAQAIVILGGGGERAYAPEYRGPGARPILLERLAYGVYLARHTGLPLLVSGFRIEAVAMRDTLERNFGITPRWVDDRAYDTFGNAHDSARILRAAGVRRILLVAGATQEWRAVHEFSAAGMSVVPAPAGLLSPRQIGPLPFRFVPTMAALMRSYQAVYELLAEPVRVALAWSGLRRQ